MIDRIDFIRGAIASLLALVGLKLPIEAEASMGDLPVLHVNLWPNDKPFYCVQIPRDATSVGLIGSKSLGCPVCRFIYNHNIIESDPEWYEDVALNERTGRWYVGGNDAQWDHLAFRVARGITP